MTFTKQPKMVMLKTVCSRSFCEILILRSNSCHNDLHQTTKNGHVENGLFTVILRNIGFEVKLVSQFYIHIETMYLTYIRNNIDTLYRSNKVWYMEVTNVSSSGWALFQIQVFTLFPIQKSSRMSTPCFLESASQLACTD